MSNQKECTLLDINFHFNYNENCSTCENGECHAMVQTDDKHYWIPVLGTSKLGPFIVTIIDNKSIEPNRVESFSKDSDCAVFLRDTFGFKCE
ncbi:MAG: hypothetical protein IPN15_11270 [Saprospiraceae bacterium]|nr:hypothetical protein [Candidatus Vicinibacter affinis]